MPTNYPGALDTTTNLSTSNADSTSNATVHPGLHNSEDGALIALETKVGIGASTPTSGLVLTGGVTPGTSSWRLTGQRFSAVAYGVVGDNNNATATANGTALNACIAAALAAGDGAQVDLDWTGTAYLPGGHTIYKRVIYKGNTHNVSKLANSAAAGTHVWQTLNFATLTQTVHASWDVGAYEFTFRDHVVDGNKANNATGGHGLALAGYGYILDNLILENCHSAGWWSEWNNTGEPLGSGGSQRQRRFQVGKVTLRNNDCANVAAANTRSSESRAAVTGGQACLFGPGDSLIDEITIYRDGSVAGIGFNQGNLDFNAGTFSCFEPIIDRMIIWYNHSKGAYFGGGAPVINYLHCEGATTCVEIDCQGPRIASGRVFYAQPGGTELLINGSKGHGGSISLSLENSPVAGVTKLNIGAGALIQADLNLYLDVGSALAVTLTGGSLPTGARSLNIAANNYAAATVTPGWLPLTPGSTTQYSLHWSGGPITSVTGIGYATGAGGTVTQATSKVTGVTLDKLSGAVTMNGAALGAATSATFTLTNARIAATDVVVVSIKSGATANSYQATVDAVGAGSCAITLRNISAGSLSEAVVLNFAVIKAVAA